MRPPNVQRPGGHRGEAGQTEALDTHLDTTTNVIAIPSTGWKTAMRRAHAIRRYRGTAKNYAVRLWRMSVQTALTQEVAR